MEHFICLAGLAFLASWLLRTSLGRKALANAVPRRNNMPIYLPFVPLFVWLAAASALDYATSALSLQKVQKVVLDQLIICTSAVTAITVIIILARGSFARRLKGFGLNVKTIHKDFLAACANLLSVWPLMLIMIFLTIFCGRVFYGSQYTIQQHQELQLIKASAQLPIRILIIISAVVASPILEEMLFRGLFQTLIVNRISYVVGRRSKYEIAKYEIASWISIAFSSIIFVLFHQNVAHWPALFVLAVCLGYAYEKSGSLFRPIFIHSLFNGITIAAALGSV
ncbi:MAG: CPBP family intramembrane metalloprotease [Sedimentisphaerales bacterium]|nr:CPBP family intramembrane metalloprotease [Sedimentisphaerales bacterium]